jgi:large subunit ribosomal protein L33
MKKKGNRHLIKLISSAGTGIFYISEKNKKSTKKKINLKKYDSKIKKHVSFFETKMK